MQFYKVIYELLNGTVNFPVFRRSKLKLNSVAFSPQANYIDRATAACWRSVCQLLQIERVWRGQRNGSPRPLIRFSDRSRYFFFQVAPQLSSRG
jgi:hypothetical protein